MSRNFPSFIDAFLEHNKNLGVSRKFLLWSAISGVAGCLERRTWVLYNGIQAVYPNMYIMLIADSGIANKSTASRPIMELLYQVDGLNFMSTQMSGASLVKQMSQAGEDKKFQHEGLLYKNSSLFSYSSEAKVTIGDSKGLSGVQELLTDFYDCGDPNRWSTNKGWNKDTLSGGSVTVFNPCLNLLYCSTPTWLMEAIGKSGIGGGFASRVLFVNEKERAKGSSGWIDEEDLPAKAVSENEKKLLADLQSIAQLNGQYKTSKGFKEKYNSILEERNKKVDQNPKAEMAPYYARKMWHCLKLSQVLAADQSDSMIITPEHLDAACGLLELLEPDMYEPFSFNGENKSLISFSRFWEVMRRKDSWNKRDLSVGTYKHASSSQMDEHLRTLMTMKKIMLVPEVNGFTYRVIDPSAL